ncbi:MAG: hypothetical protein KBG17_05150 [Paludibacteraceae bacterium]|nr:hypothetical protein [Paludibacteraceae bacterium]
MQGKEKRINFAAAFREKGAGRKQREEERKKGRKNFEKDLEGEIKRYNFAVPKEKKGARGLQEPVRIGMKEGGERSLRKKCNNKM